MAKLPYGRSPLFVLHYTTLGLGFQYFLELNQGFLKVATQRLKIILSVRQRVSKGDSQPHTPFDTPLRGYSGCFP